MTRLIIEAVESSLICKQGRTMADEAQGNGCREAVAYKLMWDILRHEGADSLTREDLLRAYAQAFAVVRGISVKNAREM